MATKQLNVRYSFENSQQFEGQAKKTAASVDQSLRSIETRAGSLSGALRLLGPLIGTISVGALLAFAKSSLDAAGGLGELAEQLGVNTDELQVYQFAATQAGISSEQLETGLQQLSRRLSEAAEGTGDAVKRFKDLGVRILDAQGNIRPTGELLEEIAEAIKGVEDPTRRAAIVVDIFGRSGQRLLPLLTQGADGIRTFAAEAKAAGAVLSADQIAAADKASDAIAALTFQWNKFAQTLTTVVAPALTSILDQLNSLIRQNNPREVANRLTQQLQRVTEEETRLNEVINNRALTASQRDNARQQLERLRAGTATARRQLAQAQAEIDSTETFIIPPAGTREGARFAQPRETNRGGADRFAQQFESLRGRLDPAWKATQELTEAMALLDTAVARGNISVEERTQLLEAFRQAQFDASDAGKQAADDEREYQRIIEATATPMEQYQKRLQELLDLRQRLGDRFTQAQFDRALTQAQENLAKATQETNDAVNSLGLTFSSAFEDAVIRGEKLRNVLQGVAQDIARLILRKTITEPLFKGITSFLGFSAQGNVFAEGRMQRFAAGGLVTAPTVFQTRSGAGIMGEAGPEAIMPLRRLPSGDLGVQTMGGAGGITVAPVINVSVEGSDVNQDQGLQAGQNIARMVQLQIDQVIMRHLQPGGYIYNFVRQG